MALLVSYTLFNDLYPKESIDRTDMDWDALVSRVKNPPKFKDKKDCPLISMGEYGDKRSSKGFIRHSENVQRIFGVEFDYDGEKVSLEAAAHLLRQANIKSVLYTSPSHTAAKPRWRGLFPLNEPDFPEKRAEYVGRINRILGGIGSNESFALSQSFFIGRVEGREYEVIETQGRCIEMATEIDPLYPASHSEVNRDLRTNDDLRASFDRGEDRYQAMMKLSSRWAARGMEYDDICAALHELLAKGNTYNADGIDLLDRIQPLAESAVKKFGRKFGGPNVLPFPTIPTKGATHPDPAPLIKLSRGVDIARTVVRASWLLKPYLEKKCQILMYGDAGTFKSFLALDWAMQVARAGYPAVILSAEGRGLWKRLRSWCIYHVPEQSWEQTLEETPIFAIEIPLNLSDDSTLIELQRTLDEHAITPGLVVVDTLSKFSDGRAEATNEDANAYLNRMGQAITVKYGASTILVHHTGHMEKGRHRGAYSLMGSTDANFLIARPDPEKYLITVTSGRMKDSEKPEPFELEAKIVEIDEVDEMGRQESSLALFATGKEPTQPEKKRPVGKAQKALLEYLESRTKEPGCIGVWNDGELRDILRGLGFHKNTARGAVLGLRQMGYLTPTIGGSRLSHTPE